MRVLARYADVERNDEIIVTGRIVISRENRVAATLISHGGVQVISARTGLSSALTQIRVRFRQEAAKFGGEPAALIPGIVIGDTSLQSQNFADAMRRAGLSHLTAVSGANFAIVSGFLLWGIQFLLPRRGYRTIVVAIFLSLFVALVGPSPSVLRAAVMAAVLMVARARGNDSLSATSLGAAIAILLLLDPFQAFEPGFILSVVATAALIFLAPTIEKFLTRWLFSWLAAMIAVPTAATLLCAPYIMYLSGELSIGTIFFNLLVAPVIGPLTILAFISALICIPFPALAHIILLIAYPLSKWIVIVAYLHQSVPTMSAAPMTLAISILALIALYRKFKRFVILFIALILFIRIFIPSPQWKVAQCDVGQGDALLLNLGRHQAILFDTGPDSRLLNRCLRQFGVHSLPLVVLTHMHADHYGGLDALNRFHIGEIWTNSQPMLPIGQELFNRVPSRIVHLGEERKIDGADIQVLWPSESQLNFEALPGDGSAENNRSIVSLIRYEGIEILVTGDIEPPVQESLESKIDLSRISIMKVPHHGSRYQDPNFLRHAKIALISVGAGNSYGHPGKATIETLKAATIRTFRTDKDGAIAIDWRPEESSGYVFSVHCIRKAWWSIQWR